MVFSTADVSPLQSSKASLLTHSVQQASTSCRRKGKIPPVLENIRPTMQGLNNLYATAPSIQSGDSSRDSKAREQERNEPCSDLLGKLVAYAARKGQPNIACNLSGPLLDILLQQRGVKGTFKALQQCGDAVEKIRYIEKQMDRCHFVELIQADYWRILGRTHEGYPILWCSSINSMYSYKRGSGRYFAILRAFLWFAHALFRHMTENSVGVLFVLEPVAKASAMNPAYYIDMLSLLMRLHPVAVGKVCFCSTGPGTRAAWKLTMAVLGSRFKETMAMVEGKHGVLDLVANKDDVPDWWFTPSEREHLCLPGLGKPFVLNRNSVWFFERCLDLGESTITAKDIFVEPDFVMKEEYQSLLTAGICPALSEYSIQNGQQDSATTNGKPSVRSPTAGFGTGPRIFGGNRVARGARGASKLPMISEE